MGVVGRRWRENRGPSRSQETRFSHVKLRHFDSTVSRDHAQSHGVDPDEFMVASSSTTSVY